MNSDLPKVLHIFQGKPLIVHVLDNLRKAGVSDIYVIVGYRGEMVIEAIGGRAKPVWQYEQLGTGHAVMRAEEALAGFTGSLIVACGDVPLIRPETFRSLAAETGKGSVKAAVLTMMLDNPTGYGRILINASGNFVRIVEEKDATPEEKKIREVNTGTYVFDKRLLFEGLRHINTDNAQGEYYLPDALQHIMTAGFGVKTVPLSDPTEGSGVNTREELQRLEEYSRTMATG